MAEPICEDEGTLQEWAPETKLLQQIPLRVQRGIFSHNLNLTCVDVVSEYLALGTNCGLIYWYCRATNELQRLRFENSSNVVTCVKIVSTVDYMVAAGTDRGNMTVFQIPKILPDSIPGNLKPKKNQVERFTINGLHNASVTNIEWSQNGMKLFSGDKNGLVVLTEIDFYMHLSKSTELLNEQFEIVQLCYSQQILLISTTFRSIICDGLDKWKVHQVGTKERKILGKFGATFCNFEHESVIYASRPGHRLWLANKNGIVQQTLLFKNAIPSSYPRIQLINPINKIECCDTNFGKLVQFGGNKLIAYNSEIMYVLHPGAISVVSSLNSARRIMDLAVNEDEIFILEGERSLLRIGYTPDKYCFDDAVEGSSRRRSFIFDQFASKLKDTAMESIKRITSELIITPEKISPNSPPVLADEALDLPPIVNMPAGSISSIVPEESVEIYFSVDRKENKTSKNLSKTNVGSSHNASGLHQEDFLKGKECDEMISRPLRRRNPRRNKVLASVQGPESESDTTSNASEERLVWGIANELSISEESGFSFSQSQSSFSILRDIPTLLTAANKTVKSESLQDGSSKTPDDKSLASLDTCESVSEHLRLTPERFLEEQEKTFFRLANQEISLLDSYNSEKTDNMSISLNMTPSSSVSSKISDNAQSNSEVSENISMLSESKTENSPSTNNSQNDSLPLPKHLCYCTSFNTKQGSVSSQEEKLTISANTSASSESSQQFSGMDNFTWTADGQLINVHEWQLSTPGVNRNLLPAEICNNNEDTNENHSEKSKEEQEADSSENKDCHFKLENVSENEVERMHRSSSVGPRESSVSESVTGTNEIGKSTEFDSKGSTYQSSIEPINYGPPSGSSTLDRNTSLDGAFSNNLLSIEVIPEQSDHWLQYQIPEQTVSLALSNCYVVCIDTKEQVYFSELSGLSLSWNLLSYKASWISLSNNVIWVLHKKKLYSFVVPTKKGPFADSMMEHCANVKSVALDNENPEGWIVKTDGRIKRQRNLLGAPLCVPEDVPCDWRLTSVACWNGVVLAITTEESVVCKPPSEERFRSIMTPKLTIRYIELGPNNLAWFVDDRNNIYFSDDYLSKDPHWWQFVTDDYIFHNSSSLIDDMHRRIESSRFGAHINWKTTMITSNENSVWVFDKCSATVKINKSSISGYVWSKIGSSSSLPSIRWQSISANGVFENKGHIWLLSTCGDLFCSRPDSKQFLSVPAPCDEISCISSSTDAFWVLSSNGQLYSRLGLNSNVLIGNSWKELHLPYIEDLKLCWISCGCDVAWGCDTRGRVFVTIDSPYHMTTNVFDSAWLEVEGKAKSGTKFEKVFVGPHLYMVWAIDDKQNIYVREGIFPHFQIGTGWVYVAGLEAVSITISSTSVWALSAEGSIYHRCGISQSNYIGDYWRRIPGSLTCVASSFTDGLWGIDHNNSMLKLNRKTIILSPGNVLHGKEQKYVSASDEKDDDWEMPDGLYWS